MGDGPQIDPGPKPWCCPDLMAVTLWSHKSVGNMVTSYFFPKASPMLGFSFILLCRGGATIQQRQGGRTGNRGK